MTIPFTIKTLSGDLLRVEVPADDLFFMNTIKARIQELEPEFPAAFQTIRNVDPETYEPLDHSHHLTAESTLVLTMSTPDVFILYDCPVTPDMSRYMIRIYSGTECADVYHIIHRATDDVFAVTRQGHGEMIHCPSLGEAMESAGVPAYYRTHIQRVWDEDDIKPMTFRLPDFDEEEYAESQRYFTRR